MLVDKQSLENIITNLESMHIGLDTETYGATQFDTFFSIIISDGTENYYFNFNPYKDHLGKEPDPKVVLGEDELNILDRALFTNPQIVWYIHNAKFDLNILANQNIHLAGRVHCSLVTERLLNNNAMSISLGACAKRRGLEKDDTVEKYINENKLYKTFKIPGKKKTEKKKYFYLVPLNIMVPYGKKDAYLHRVIGMEQEKVFHETAL